MARARRRGGSFLLGLLTGLLIFIFLLVGAGFYVYYSLNIRKIEDLIKVEVPVGNDEFKELPVKDLVKLFQDLFSNTGELTIGTLESKYGLTLPDKIGGLDVAKIKESIKDCRVTDFSGMINKLTASLTIEDLMIATGSGVPDSIKALASYTLDDVLGKDGGKGLQGILEEVKIGDLLGVDMDAADKPSGVDDVLWLLRNYTVFGDGGIQNMGNDLTLSDLTALGISFAGNEMLTSIASNQKLIDGKPVFVDSDKKELFFSEGKLTDSDGTETDPAAYAVYPKIEDGKLVADVSGKQLYTDGTTDYLYDAISGNFTNPDGSEAAVPAGKLVKPQLYKLSELGTSVNSLTLGDLLGDKLPDALQSFKNTRLDQLDTLGVAGIYISDLLDKETTEGILFKLANIVGTKEIAFGGANKVTAETYKHNDVILYKIPGMQGYYYESADGTFAPYTGLAAGEEPAILSYTVDKIDDAVNQLTLEDVLGDGKVPDMLGAFAKVKIEDIGKELTIENIYLTDIVGSKPSALLKSLTDVQGHKEIDLAGDGVLVDALLWRSTDKMTVYYEVGGALYVKDKDGKFSTASSDITTADLVALSYSIDRVSDAMNELTLENVLGEGNVPDILVSFAGVKIGNFKSELTIDNIYLTDIASGVTGGILRTLADKHGTEKITPEGGTEITAKLWRSADKKTVYYEDSASGTLYVKIDGKYVPAPSDVVTSDLTKLSNSVKNLNDSINDTTLEELVGALPAPFDCLNGTKIGNLSAKLGELTVADLFPGDLANGALSLLENPDQVKLKDIPTAMGNAISTATMRKLKKAGLIKITEESLEKEIVIDLSGTKIKLGDMTLDDILDWITVPKLP